MTVHDISVQLERYGLTPQQTIHMLDMMQQYIFAVIEESFDKWEERLKEKVQ